MTRAVDLPSDEHVRGVLEQLRSRSTRPVTARALAEALGLSNTTLWRRFPAIAQQVADDRRVALRAHHAVNDLPSAEAEVVERLRRDLQRTHAELELAIAQIQRLAIENRALQAMSLEGSITPLRRRKSVFRDTD